MKTIEIEDGFKIPMSKSKIMLAWFISLCFVAMGLWLTFYDTNFKNRSDDVDRVLIWCGIGFFGLGVVGLPVALLNSKGGLYITSRGIDRVSPFRRNSFIAWDEIKSFGEMKIRRTRFLLVYVKNESAYLSKLSSIKRSLAEASINSWGSPYSLSTSTYQCSFEELKEILQSNFEKYANRSIGTQ